MIKMMSCIVLALALTVSVQASATPTDDATAVMNKVADAFNKGDAKAVAANWADDGDLINPIGIQGKGRAGVEKVAAGDIATILKGTTSKFTVDSAREVGTGTWLVDASHEAANFVGPDGKKTTLKLHVVVVMTMSKDKKLQIAAARPYAYLPAPPAKK